MTNTFHGLPDTLHAYPGGQINKCHDCNDGYFLYPITNTTKEDFLSYQKSLLSYGFSLYDSHTIRDNYFATYTYKELLLHIYYTTQDSVTRIVLGPTTSLYKKEKDVPSSTSYQTTLYQMELDYRTIDCGMCYIVQSADGSFFIIDSAHMNSTNDHIRLYQLLRRLTPKDKPIIIAGWFFSHAHQDHICKFMDFIKEGFSDCIIEGLYYNFPSLTAPGNETWKEGDKQTMVEFFELVEKNSEIPRYKLHTGQHFFVRNLEFEVLATHEDLYPQPLTRFNDTSTVLLMTVDGCKTLFLGDSNVEESTIMVARYGSYMKSDIVQVAHHGYNGSNVGVYFCARADVALYPTPVKRYMSDINSEANKTVHKISKEIYVAENGTVALSLPYVPETAVVFPKEII